MNSADPNPHLSRMNARRLGSSDLIVSPVGLGCWPMAGITSIVDSPEQCVTTIQAALDAGINFFDTAYSYGFHGESDEYLRRGLQGRRQQVILASKVGIQWDENRQRRYDARPQTLLAHAEIVLQRLGVDYVDLMYLHAPDGETPLEESAAAIQKIVDRGWARYAGVSNVSASQAAQFHRVCPVIAVQPPFNMLQQETVKELGEFCQATKVGLVCYWVLMKGLLAGHLTRNHQFDPRDSRLKYELFQGQAWQRNQDFVDQLREISQRLNCTVSQLVIAWSLAQQNVCVALCGAKHPEQIVDNAAAMHVSLSDDVLDEIDRLIIHHHDVLAEKGEV